MKRIPHLLLSAFTLACVSAFADTPPPANPVPVTRGLDLEHTTVPPAYNFPAAINTHKWDYFVDASFIYWHVSEEFLQVGIDYKITEVDPVSSKGGAPSFAAFKQGTMLGPKFAYRPGFKVAFGVDTPFDDWAVNAEWTRISEEITTQYHIKNSLGGALVAGADIWTDLWGPFGAMLPQHTKWSFHLNLFDLSVQRPFYQGKRLIISPVMGLRGITLKQSTKYQSTDPTLVSPNTLTIDYTSHLWGIGPRLGADLEWLLYKELRVIGLGAGSLLYTRYTSNNVIGKRSPRITLSRDASAAGEFPAVSVPQFSALRANLELDLGLGWGMYFSEQKYHIDFTATYDFQAFFKMNVMSALTPSWVGDIYLHGLTVSGRFDF